MKILVATFASLVLAVPVFAAGGETDYKSKFQELDTNSNSTLSPEEFQAKGKDAQAFSQYDLDGNGEVSEEEFISVKKAKKERKEGQGTDSGTRTDRVP